MDLLDIAGCITRLHWIACIYPRNIGEFKQSAFILQYFVLVQLDKNHFMLLEDFFKKIDWGRVRIKRYPNRIFLCGKAQASTSIRSLLQKNPLPLDQYVIAENAMSWKDAKAFASDLLDLEEYFAAAARLIVIVSESPGSFAEMGAFVSNEKIQDKVLIITQEQYYKSDSFIRYGIIQHLQGPTPDPTHQICIIPTIKPLKPKELSKYQAEIINLVRKAIEKFPQKSTKFDKKSASSQVLLIRDIILLSSTIEKTRLQKIACGILGRKIEAFESTFLKIMFVLEKFQLIQKNYKGSQVFYTSLERDLCLQYPTASYAESAVALQKSIEEEIYRQDKKETAEIRNTIHQTKEKFLSKNFYSKLEQKIFAHLPMMYKVFYIPKKNGGKREIAQPTPFLKRLQKETLGEISKLFTVHPSATAYIKEKNGILSNATAHLKNKYFLKLDFADFFHSINAETVNAVFERKQISLSDRLRYLKIFLMFDKTIGKAETNNVYKLLKNPRISEEELINLITQKYRSAFRLSIGAPSSPYISNIIMYDFDTHLSDWCKKKKISYSRYADDLTFSSDDKKQLEQVLPRVKKILQEIPYLSLKINQKKTKSLSLRQRVTITGLNVTSEHKISVGREQKKLIRVLLHHLSLKTLSPNKYDYLKGWLSYIKDVEPKYFTTIMKKHAQDIDVLYSAPKKY